MTAYPTLNLLLWVLGLGFRVEGWNEGMEKTMEATIMGTTIRIHSFIPSYGFGYNSNEIDFNSHFYLVVN